MEKPIISVENLGKSYKLGLKEAKYPTFREALVGAAAAPLRRLRHLGGRANGEDEQFWAVRDVSFEVKRGEVVGIIGRNGAGKSTLLKILSRITEPTTGRAVLRGRVASLLEVGTGFHPELTGRENIYLNGSILGMKRGEISRKFDEIVEFAEVERFLDTPVKHYSSGMYVRLAFAVAAHLEPEILIVDEVLAVGDAEFQKKCLGKMQEVTVGGSRTVLFVSHNMSAVLSLCGSAIVMKDGLVVANSPIEQAVVEYLGAAGNAHGDVNMSAASGPIKRMRVLNEWGVPTTVFESGELIVFELHFDFDSEPRDPIFGITVSSECGGRVFTASNCFSGQPIGGVRRGFVRCEASDVRLVAGSYRVRVGMDDRGGTNMRLDDVLQFQVVDSSIQGLKRPSSVHGALVVDGNWRVESAL